LAGTAGSDPDSERTTECVTSRRGIDDLDGKRGEMKRSVLLACQSSLLTQSDDDSLRSTLEKVLRDLARGCDLTYLAARRDRNCRLIAREEVGQPEHVVGQRLSRRRIENGRDAVTLRTFEPPARNRERSLELTEEHIGPGDRGFVRARHLHREP